MAKIKIKESLLKLQRKIIGKGKSGGYKIVAVTGNIGDWAGYMALNTKNWSYTKIAKDGYKIFIDDIDKYFSITKKVRGLYRR